MIFFSEISYLKLKAGCVLKGGAAGGICEKATTFRDGKKKSLNTGVVTFAQYSKQVPRKVSQLTFPHETGFNFGAVVSKVCMA